MQPDRRDRRRLEAREEIKDTARALLAEQGAAGLSLRAIAKRMGMTAPGLYHYFGSINDLITALILDAFTQLAEAVEKADADVASRGGAERLVAVAHAWRRWALDHPIDFQLLYGSPIPTYEQPTDTTYPAARRSFVVTATIFAQAIERGEIDLPVEYRRLPPEIERSLDALTGVEGHDLPPHALYLAAISWARLHGHIMLELFHLIQPVIGNVDALFDHEVQALIRQVGFTPTA
jgi:AcrR family transcriptional regulator